LSKKVKQYEPFKEETENYLQNAIQDIQSIMLRIKKQEMMQSAL
jgi:hypothetical protein